MVTPIALVWINIEVNNQAPWLPSSPWQGNGDLFRSLNFFAIPLPDLGLIVT